MLHCYICVCIMGFDETGFGETGFSETRQGSHFSSKIEFPDFSLTSKMKFQVSGQ